MSVDQHARHRPAGDRPPLVASPRVAVGLAVLAFLLPFALLLVLVVSGVGWAARADSEIAESAHELVGDQPWLVTANLWLHWIVHPLLLRAAALVIAIRLWWVGRRPDAAWLVTTMAAAWLLSGVIKAIVGRDRPIFEEPFTVLGGHSFPSGHALSGAAFAGCLIILSRPLPGGLARGAVRALAVAVLLLAGLNRVALGVHFASDVLAGWLLGGAVVVAVSATFAVLATRRQGTQTPPDR